MMRKTKIGAVTIGQAPRDDVTPDFLAAAGPGIELLQRGALDDFSAERIEAEFSPQARDNVLVTRLRSGKEIKIAEAKIMPLIQECIYALEQNGAELIVIFCTGEFPDITANVPIIRPDRLLAHCLSAINPQARLCVVLPSPLQTAAMKNKWRKNGFTAETVALSPYAQSEAELSGAVSFAAQPGFDMVVLDCIGYSAATKAAFQKRCACPVVLPRTLLGRISAEFAG